MAQISKLESLPTELSEQIAHHLCVNLEDFKSLRLASSRFAAQSARIFAKYFHTDIFVEDEDCAKLLLGLAEHDIYNDTLRSVYIWWDWEHGSEAYPHKDAVTPKAFAHAVSQLPQVKSLDVTLDCRFYSKEKLGWGPKNTGTTAKQWIEEFLTDIRPLTLTYLSIWCGYIDAQLLIGQLEKFQSLTNLRLAGGFRSGSILDVLGGLQRLQRLQRFSVTARYLTVRRVGETKTMKCRGKVGRVQISGTFGYFGEDYKCESSFYGHLPPSSDVQKSLAGFIEQYRSELEQIRNLT